MPQSDKHTEPIDIVWPDDEIDDQIIKKTLITIRLDDDLLQFFKQQGSGYQTRINAVLRHYVKYQQKAGLDR